MFGLLNTSNNRETSCLWRFRIRGAGQFEIREMSRKAKGAINTYQYSTREELQKGVKEYSGKSLTEVDEIHVIIPRNESKYKIISDKIHIMDVPGLEDEEYYTRLLKHLSSNISNSVPILVYNLT